MRKLSDKEVIKRLSKLEGTRMGSSFEEFREEFTEYLRAKRGEPLPQPISRPHTKVFRQGRS